MTEVLPTVGRIVLFKLSQTDADEINRRRDDYKNRDKSTWPLGAQSHVGNEVHEGDVFPMQVVHVWSENMVNGKVFLDGSDDYWATSVHQGEGTHQWDWMPFQKDQQERLAKE